MTQLSTLTDTRRARYRPVVQAQKWRRPMALIGAGFALCGLIQTVFYMVNESADPSGIALTHPLTAAALIWLGLGVFGFRRGKRTSRLKYTVTTMFLGICLANLVMGTWGSGLFLNANARVGRMGPDTAIILSLLFGALLLRRMHERQAISLLLIASSLVVNAAIGKSYSANHFGGHMSHMTMLALLFNTAAVLTIFAPRPLLRVAFLADEIGQWTRRMLASSVAVPWLSGAALFLTVPMNDRAARLESLSISLIVIAMAGISIYSGYQNDRADQRRRRAEQTLLAMATRDMLTGVMNRAGLLMRLELFWADFRKGGPSCGVILLDLDHFKRINDCHGHDEGDRVLAMLGTTLRPLLRKGDALGRWGGEEFLLLLPGAAVEDLPEIAERVRQQIEAVAERVAQARVAPGAPDVPHYDTTASIGVSQFLGRDRQAAAAIKRADDALYRAKDAGRNRVEMDPAIPLRKAA